jgi:hypothetical protein
MLNFYINRGGKNIPASRHRVLEKARDELRALWKTSQHEDLSMFPWGTVGRHTTFQLRQRRIDGYANS